MCRLQAGPMGEARSKAARAGWSGSARHGKSAALNRGATVARREILVFSDANNDSTPLPRASDL